MPGYFHFNTTNENMNIFIEKVSTSFFSEDMPYYKRKPSNLKISNAHTSPTSYNEKYQEAYLFGGLAY